MTELAKSRLSNNLHKDLLFSPRLSLTFVMTFDPVEVWLVLVANEAEFELNQAVVRLIQ
jgi:hypothetical protein